MIKAPLEINVYVTTDEVQVKIDAGLDWTGSTVSVS